MPIADLALITGATSGIGEAFARLHANKGGDLIITARRAAELEAMKAELEATHGITVYAIPADLGTSEGIDALLDIVATIEIPDILINSAGFGGHGPHVLRDLATEQAMIDLNIKAVVTVTHRIGGAMARRGSGKILNVSSTAGFAPGPLQAVYFASKAFVTSYSQALDQELRPRGVTCTALAPGFVETNFAKRADIIGTAFTKAGGASADSVAQCGYKAMQQGKLVAVNDRLLGFVMQWMMPLMPRRFVLEAIQRSQSKD
ncbi:hypothetical protein SAMN06273572_101234 [Monaibacterium marinum]|uniref:Ketoreductase domain-containing protein n=1 Tax=Pontivivens marinum TaxID=1690039 RepID=A0A2C9CPV5_9RHOB|nr:SDR family NAD(P)-dependent oxidoreductase [Monaibacterium marinum]SOH92389.1 hypothetical protein SAMN06273572_101234 [Monaibacterium marinum]